MPRTKGSKNKPKTVTADFATQIAEKQSEKEALTAEIASITANIETLKADLKEKKSEEGRKRSGHSGSKEGKGRCQGCRRSKESRSGIRSEKIACRGHECR